MAKARSIPTRLLRLLENTADPVYVLDADRAILFCNQACANWIGVEAASLVGRRVDYVTGDEMHGVPGAAAGLCPPPDVFAGRARSGHVSSMSSGGRLLYRKARFMPLADEDGNTLAVFAYLEHTDLHASDLQSNSSPSSTTDYLHAVIRQFRAEHGSRHGLVELLGETPSIKQVRARVQLAAGSRASVLITGPIGSGQAAVARAIHDRATREGGRFVPLDCELLTEEILKDALADLRSGDNPAALTTLLLQDIDKLPAELQSDVLKLVRTSPGPRIIGTSSCLLTDWAKMLPNHGELAWVIGTLVIELPPLQSRRADLPVLAHALMEQCNSAGSKQLSGLAEETLEQLAWHNWDGDVQELREVIKEAYQKAHGSKIDPEDLPSRLAMEREAAAAPQLPADVPMDLEAFLREVQIELVTRALERAAGNRTQAARLLGMSRMKFYRRLEQLGLSESLSGNAESESEEDE